MNVQATGTTMIAVKAWLRALVTPFPLAGLIYLPRYFTHWRRFAKLSSAGRLRLKDSYPCLLDWTPRTSFDPHYFYQAAWLARRLRERLQGYHVDVGSSVMMINVLSAWADTVFVDYRPLHAKVSGLFSVAGTITQLPFGDGTVSSLSCLHVIEHIGLGRYGDPLDPDGHAKAARELARVLEPGGTLYLSAPVGRERVCFNAHRVFDPTRLVQLFPGLRVREFSYVDDGGNMNERTDPRAAQSSDYACGMYIMEKTG